MTMPTPEQRDATLSRIRTNIIAGKQDVEDAISENEESGQLSHGAISCALTQLREAMIGRTARNRMSALDDVQRIHRAVVPSSSFGEVTRVSNCGGVRHQRVGIEADDDVGLVEVVVRA